MPRSSIPPRRLPLLLRRAWYGLNQAFRRRIAHTGCTPDQYTVLRNLAETNGPGLTQSTLTTLMSSDPNTVAGLVRRMERAGLLKRVPHEGDGRARRLVLLPEGMARYQVLRRIAMQLQKETLIGLGQSESDQFLRTLEQVANSCWDAGREES